MHRKVNVQGCFRRHAGHKCTCIIKTTEKTARGSAAALLQVHRQRGKMNPANDNAEFIRHCRAIGLQALRRGLQKQQRPKSKGGRASFRRIEFTAPGGCRMNVQRETSHSGTAGSGCAESVKRSPNCKKYTGKP